MTADERGRRDCSVDGSRSRNRAGYIRGRRGEERGRGCPVGREMGCLLTGVLGDKCSSQVQGVDR